MPMTSVGTRLDDNALRIAAVLRLGAPVCVPNTCTLCGAAVDSTGYHGLSRRKSAGREASHKALNSVIKAALTASDVPSRLEPCE